MENWRSSEKIIDRKMCYILSFFVVISSLNANENQNAAENVIRRAYTLN